MTGDPTIELIRNKVQECILDIENPTELYLVITLSLYTGAKQVFRNQIRSEKLIGGVTVHLEF